MGKGNREAFTLNESSSREKIVFDFLQTQYNKSQVIKDILYEYIMSNNLQISTQHIQHNHVINTTKCVNDVSNVYKDTQQNDVIVGNDVAQVNNKIDTSTPKDNASNDNDFSIDLNSIDDEEVNISTEKKNKSATENALDFVLGM
ncbi:hypothetical protein [Clostridium uliginosum]|uniref:Uncharacterized protein n=1 Tax=Clostridium uliginosum TaxID=119641 RepID=A0A1I1GS87_9CLOT|nr:hypothetical protein [Clostridium uliginosum]SFC14356.1 hypothetical protein SAMN05421842_10141 [Clostridium uliginosum]